uniref:Uncharacterized protein n=1 Tax=viral metagenome TaxID=1070528 RepID=A0A6M3IYX2_9ZZZZ
MPKLKPRTKKGKRAAVKGVMHEFKEGTLHSGSRMGPIVMEPDQAVAIAMHEAGIRQRPKKRTRKKART